MSDEKTFSIGYIGTNRFKPIKAKTVKEAKKLFAEIEGVEPSSYIVSQRRI